MSDTRDKLPLDADEAERGSYAESTSANPQKNRSNEEFNHNAKAWAMYLQEAEENAKEQAEVWKTGLESLLIFAGLFASVITSFLAESRKKLRLEDSEALLMDIRSALRNETQSDVAYKPTPAQVWVNGLWFTSLLLTLFSAIVGVLARSWLVNHLPVSNRKEAKDAHKRWTLDERAERWKLQRVITGIPLLVQVAFFLFSFGLAIQTYVDNKTLGVVVLSLVAGSTLLYLVVTALPLMHPPDSCPFQTPLSELLHGLQARFLHGLRPKGGPESGDTPEAPPDSLANILCKGLIESRKADLADEAAFELSRHPPPSRHLQVFLDSDTPEVCVQRIQDCTSMRFQDSSRRDEIIGAHLQVLLWLVASWEENGHDKAIGARFQKLIGRIGILGRWDFLPDSQRALAYAVRVPLYLASNRDFEEIVSPGQEWETITRHIQPTYRLGFVISACRGTVQGEQNIRRVSLFSVVHLMAQGYIPAVSQGHHTEWNHQKDEDRVRRLCGDYLGRLFKSIASTWEEKPGSFLSILGGRQIQASGAAPDIPYAPMFALKPQGFRSSGYPPPNLRYALTSLEAGVRSQGGVILAALAKQGCVESSNMKTLLAEFFETIFDSSYNTSTVKESIGVAAFICATTYNELVIKILSERIQTALKGTHFDQSHESLKRGLEVVDCIIIWAQKEGFHGIEEVLWIVAPRLTEIDLTAVVYPSLERWHWLDCLLKYSGNQLHRYVMQVQGPLRLTLTKVFKREGGNDGLVLGNYTLDSVAKLLSFSINAEPDPNYLVLDFETLEAALAPNIANVVSLALRATSDSIISAGVSVLLALSERWHSQFLEGPGWAYNATPSASVREAVYGTIQTSLQDGISCEAPVSFMRLLLAGMKGIEEYAKITNLPAPVVSGSGNTEAAGSITRGGPRLGLVVAELLKCFIKTRWGDIHAVQLLVDLVSEDVYFDAVVACVPKAEVWNEGQGGCAGAVPLIATLVQSLVDRGWGEGIHLLLELVTSSCVDTRDAAIRELLFLSNNQGFWETIMDGIKSKIQTSTGDKAEQYSMADIWKELLIVIATNATARDFCSCVLEYISSDTSSGQNLDLPTKLPPVALPDFTQQIEGLSLHSNVRIRQAALAFLAKINPASIVKRLLVLALDDSDERLKRSCLTQLIDMASNDKLILPMITAIKDIDQKKVGSIPDVSWRKDWVTLLKTVSRHGTYLDGLIALVRIAEIDEFWEVRVAAIQSLSELADGHSETIITRTILTQNAKAGSGDPISHVRRAWVSTLGKLSKTGHWKQGQEALIDMALHDSESDVRGQAYCEIDMLLHAGADRVSTLASLTNALERIFRANYDGRNCAIEFTGLTGRGSPLTLSISLASAFLQALIKQVLVDSGVSNSSDEILDEVANYAKSGHHNVILRCVIENLGSSSSRGAEKAMRLVSRIKRISDRTWMMDPFAAWLPPLFQHTSKHVRAAILGLFSTIVSGEYNYNRSTDVMVPLLVSMALEDQDESLRDRASVLLSVICAEYGPAQREVATPANVHRFLELLSAPRPLNTSVARLLGLLYQRKEAREPIGSWIIDNAVIARKIASSLEQGILTLLSELVCKRTLNTNVALDYLLLLLSSSFALKGTTATEPHRPLILTSLSLHYRNEVPQRSSEFRKLSQAFEYAAFGRHGTPAEAKAWLAMEQYLKEQPQPSQRQDAEGGGSSPKRLSQTKAGLSKNPYRQPSRLSQNPFRQ